MNGFGRVFKRHRIWWIAYNRGGKEFRESVRSTKRQIAVDLLKQRNQERSVMPGKVSLGEILDDRTSDANLRGNRSTRHLPRYHRHIISFFGDVPARDIIAPNIRQYQATRLNQGASPATVNREVSSLGTALRLAVESGLLAQCPPFPPRLRESEPRQGFFEYDDYVAIHAEFEPWAQDVLEFGYFTGWRRGEILGLTWGEVFSDDDGGGTIRLDPARSKNRRARIRPITEELRPVILRRSKNRIFSCPYVFHRGGRCIPAATFHVAWAKARKAAGRDYLLFHDLRRTVVRNLIRAGVRERVAMEYTGHLTRHVFDRYHIIQEDDLVDAADKLKRYVNDREDASKVVPLFPRKKQKLS